MAALFPDSRNSSKTLKESYMCNLILLREASFPGSVILRRKGQLFIFKKLCVKGFEKR
jgi:hypothetical protein